MPIYEEEDLLDLCGRLETAFPVQASFRGGVLLSAPPLDVCASSLILTLRALRRGSTAESVLDFVRRNHSKLTHRMLFGVSLEDLPKHLCHEHALVREVCAWRLGIGT